MVIVTNASVSETERGATLSGIANVAVPGDAAPAAVMAATEAASAQRPITVAATPPAPNPVPHEFAPAALAEQAWRDAARVRPGSLVAVSSADGGVGRSTLAAALGGLLALAVPGPVIAVDCNPRPWGGLGDRVGTATGSVWDAARMLPQLTGRADIERWTRRGPSGLLALAGETTISRHRHPPTYQESIAVGEALRPWYRLIVLDLMMAEVRGVWRVMAHAAATIVVARATPDSIQHTLRLITVQANAAGFRPPVAPLLAVVSTSPRQPGEVRAVLRQAATVVPEIHPIPYDASLAVAAPIDPRLLGRPARRALLGLTAAVLRRCVSGTGVVKPS